MYQSDFPLLEHEPIVYLDSAASTQKPWCVLEKMFQFYTQSYANVHRGSCALANQATILYEEARQKVARFIHALPSQVVFTKGTTESINLIANSYAQTLREGDEVLISIAEHHANFVPWQQACLKSKATLKTFRVLPSGEIDLDDYYKQLSSKTKLVAVTHLSNVLGIVNPIETIVQTAHNVGAKVVVDGAQSIAHMPIDVQQLNCDFFVFSGHKLYAPTGIGVLYGTSNVLEMLQPYQFGGDMIKEVTIQQSTFADVPAKFEAGTPPIAQAIGLGFALDYLSHIGMAKIESQETELTCYLLDSLKQFSGIQLLGDSSMKKGIVSLTVPNIHVSDIAFVLAKQNICVRTGHHCAMPLHRFFDLTGSLRISLGVYTTQTDIDLFIKGFKKAIQLFQ